ncbi:glycosyltransferase [Streptosporangium soli]|nr:glycosyltransferase [Streptosporangium sp. KLBMP 9127]
MDPLLSVVVPFHDVEGYLDECLRSLSAQRLTDLEIIMIDDGSLDGSRLIAKEHAARDPRFTLVGCENQGPGPARNLGIRLAAGRYLAFADADDVLPPDAYARLVGSLARSGSDLACGAVERLSPEGPMPSPLHHKLFRRRREGTHITKYPDLVKDRTVWNKVYRRSFWDAHHLEFPSGLYEDVPVAMAAHVCATAVDVLPDVVYHWRLRESGETSITQRRTDLDNLRERLASLRGVQAFLADRAPELRPAFDQMAASWDLGIVAAAVEQAEPGDRERLLDLVGPFADDLDETAVAALPAIRRLELHLLRHRLVPELAQVRRVRQEGDPGEAKVVRRGMRTVRWYAGYPFFGDRSRKIPAELYDVTGELELRARVDEVSRAGERLLLAGDAFIKPFGAARTGLRFWLVEARTKTVTPVEATREGPARFVAEIDPATLAGAGPWALHVEVTGPRGLTMEGGVRASRAAAREDSKDGVLQVKSMKSTGACRIARRKPRSGS